MKKVIFKILILTFALNLVTPVFSQVEERERPAEWDQLVAGGRFIDRFLPMKGNVLSSDTWGVEGITSSSPYSRLIMCLLPIHTRRYSLIYSTSL